MQAILQDPKKLAIVIAVAVVIVVVALVVILALALGIGLGVGLSSSSSSNSSPPPSSTTYPGGLSATCNGAGSLSNPPLNISFVTNLQGQTGWFASPIVADLNGDGSLELILAYYAVYVYASNFTLLDTLDPSGTNGDYRIYAPHAVANLQGSGNTLSIVFGQGQVVYCYTFNGAKLVKQWATNTPGSTFEIRGLAVGNIAGSSALEVIVTTTNTNGTSIWAYDASGALLAGWPRYNTQDKTVNGFGNSGYGQYGLNVGLGDVSHNGNTEIVATFDDHQIQLFRGDGTSVDASTYYTYPSSPYEGNNMTWGQFIRWYHAFDEEGLYHNHTFYPNLKYEPWMQWTQSPPGVADLDQDGYNEVICVSNIETAPNNPDVYVTQAWALAVFNGDYNNLGATRKTGWNVFPIGGSPITAQSYPPIPPPAPAIVNILGNKNLEIIVTLNDGNMWCYNYNATRLWNYNFMGGQSKVWSSEPVIADLNADGSPEVIFATYGLPDSSTGSLVILAADGSELATVHLNSQGESNGNGNGVPAAPTVADINGDGHLEIFLQSFEHGTDVYTVWNSDTSCVPWKSARGGYLRTGAPS